MPIWLGLIVMAALWLAGLLVLASYLKQVIREEVRRWLEHAIENYDNVVHRQTLSEARRLVDANRKHPVRPDAGAPVKIHRRRLRG